MTNAAGTSRPFDYVASDMDGTLLRPSHLPSALTMQTLKTLVTRHGVALILATGRNYLDVHAVNARLQTFFALPDDADDADGGSDGGATAVPRPPTYLITSNGAVVYDARTHKVVSARYLDADIARQLYWLLPASETEINTHAYQHDTWWCRHDWPDILAYHKISGIRYEVCAQPCEYADTQAAESPSPSRPRGINRDCYTGVSKLFYDCKDASRRGELIARIRALFDEQAVALTFSGPHFVEAMAANVNKGSALCTVLRMMPRHDEQQQQQQQQQQQHDDDDAVLAQRLRRTIAFGDEMNDAEMLRACGQGCLMGNGNPMVKECCPHIECIASNADDGMARKLCSVFGLDCAVMEAKGNAAMQRLGDAY